jgi:RNA polymerase sigma factor (sigma-70 family)
MKEEQQEKGFESLNEPDFVARLVAGGTDEFDTLCKVGGPLLQRHINAYFGAVLNAIDVEDVIQDALVSIHKALPGFIPERAKLTTWLYQIAINEAIDHKRKLERAKRVPDKRSNIVSLEDLPNEEHQAIDITSQSEPDSKKKVRGPSLKGWATRIKNALSHLTEDERLPRINQAFMTLNEREHVILLGTVQKASSKEIASKLGISEDNVRKIRERAWEKFCSSIEEAEFDE